MYWLFTLLVVLLVTFDIIHSLKNEPVKLDDFDEAARIYVDQKAKEYGRTVEWWDLYGRNKHLVENQKYHHFKINVWSDDVQYGKVEKEIERPGYVYTKWYHNGQSVPLTSHFSRKVTLQTSYTWSVSNSIKMNTEIKATAGIPSVLGVSAYLNSSVDLQNSKGQTKQETETYEVKNIITVPPMKSVKAEFVVTEKDVQVPWEADVEIDGWISIWFTKKYNNHYLWFHPITHLANSKFKLNKDGSRLTYHATGVFRGLRGVDSVLKTYEYDLMTSYASDAENKPRKVTMIKPNFVRVSLDY